MDYNVGLDTNEAAETSGILTIDSLYTVPQASAPAPSLNTPNPTELYRRIRDQLSSAEFETFAGVVAAFNSGRAGTKETIAMIYRIVGQGTEGHEMRNLILDAVSSSRSN